MNCAEWSLIEGETYGNISLRGKCHNCGSGQLDPQSGTSERTFNIERAKSRTRKQLTVISKRRML